MEFGGLLSDPDHRYCYLRVRVLKELLKDRKILDALLDALEVPEESLTALTKHDAAEKLRLIEKQIEHFRAMKTSPWYQVPAPEVLAASIFNSTLSDKIVFKQIFCDVSREDALASPVANWLTSHSFEPYAEVSLGTKQIDVIGYKKGFWGLVERLIGIELKNEISQLQRGLDQMTTYCEYAHSVYLACTPALAAEYLDCYMSARNVEHWDSAVLRRTLESFGYGLLLVEGQTVYEVQKPRKCKPDPGRVREAVNSLSAAKENPMSSSVDLK